jgi:hypothetical protein
MREGELPHKLKEGFRTDMSDIPQFGFFAAMAVSAATALFGI